MPWSQKKQRDGWKEKDSFFFLSSSEMNDQKSLASFFAQCDAAQIFDALLSCCWTSWGKSELECLTAAPQPAQGQEGQSNLGMSLSCMRATGFSMATLTWCIGSCNEKPRRPFLEKKGINNNDQLKSKQFSDIVAGPKIKKVNQKLY